MLSYDNKRKKIFKFWAVILSLIFIQSCADLSLSPDQNGDQQNTNLKINISSPLSNIEFSEGLNEIVYSVAQPYSMKFIELYINGEFKRNYPPNQDGTAPQIFFNFDSTYVGKTINLYLIYYDKNNTSQKSNTINNLKITIDNRLPFKPYNITLINFNDGSCNISWKDSSRYVETYQIWKKTGTSGEYSLLQEVSGNSNNINDYGLENGTIYFYKVRGKKNSGFSPFSSEINSAGLIMSGNLIPPSDLSATLSGISTVELKWKDNSDNENYFVVERSIDNLKFFNIAELVRNTISFQDNSNALLIGSTYFYRIKSYSNSDSAFSNTVLIKLLSTVLLPPANLTANYDKTIGVIELNWNKSDNSTVYFDIEKKIDSNNYVFVRRIDASSNVFLDFDVSPNHNYKYRIRGYDLNLYSDYSNEVAVSTF